MTAVMIGVDPAEPSHGMAVLDSNENELAALQISNDNDGYRKMLRLAKRWKQRTWAVEGAGVVGVHLAQRLVAGSAPIEQGLHVRLVRVLGCGPRWRPRGGGQRAAARPRPDPRRRGTTAVRPVAVASRAGRRRAASERRTADLHLVRELVLVGAILVDAELQDARDSNQPPVPDPGTTS